MANTTSHQHFEHRGIRFHLTTLPDGEVIGAYDDHLPDCSLRWGSWDRFHEYREVVSESSMRKAVNRALANNPVYTGDLRYRHIDKR